MIKWKIFIKSNSWNFIWLAERLRWTKNKFSQHNKIKYKIFILWPKKYVNFMIILLTTFIKKIRKDLKKDIDNINEKKKMQKMYGDMFFKIYSYNSMWKLEARITQSKSILSLFLSIQLQLTFLNYFKVKSHDKELLSEIFSYEQIWIIVYQQSNWKISTFQWIISFLLQFIPNQNMSRLQNYVFLEKILLELHITINNAKIIE